MLSAEAPAHHLPLPRLLRLPLKSLRYLSAVARGLLRVFIVRTCFTNVNQFGSGGHVRRQHLPNHSDGSASEVVVSRPDRVKWHQDRLLPHQLDAAIFEV